MIGKLQSAWCAETSASAEWTPERPSEGQCAVTALVVQDVLGGVLLRTMNGAVSHYWNRLDDGTEIDLTRDQFDEWAPGEVIERDRDYVLDFEPTARRYALLLARLVTRPERADLDG